MKRLLLYYLMASSCGRAPTPTPALDGGIDSIDEKAWTSCSWAQLNRSFCSREQEVIHCGKFKYGGLVYLVWTTDGSNC